MRRPAWRHFELEIAELLWRYQYHSIMVQEPVAAVRSRAESKRSYPLQEYVATPRFDVIAKSPLTWREHYFECKRYENPVSSYEVESFAYRLWLCRFPIERGVMVVEPELTKGGVTKAEAYGMRVWQGSLLDRKRAAGALLSANPFLLPKAGYHGTRALIGGLESLLRKGDTHG